MMDPWERIDESISRIEGVLLVLLLSGMIVIACLQIVLRNVFDTGLAWGDPVVRNLVLWIGFIGAAIATREGKHINIDVVSWWVSPSKKRAIEAITQCFASVICGLMTYAALKFIKNETQMKSMAFLGMPVWVPELILPAIFGLMALRFGLRSVKSISITRAGSRGG